MTRDDIIEMLGWPKGDHHDSSDLLRRIMDVVAAEREACAKVCETEFCGDDVAYYVATAIRARGEAPEDKP